MNIPVPGVEVIEDRRRVEHLLSILEGEVRPAFRHFELERCQKWWLFAGSAL